MAEDAAPSSDGYTSKFFQQCWRIIGTDVHNALISFFHREKIPKHHISTNLVLIPKVPNADRLEQLRHISLRNFCYKILARLARALSFRLSPILPKVISPYQSGIVKEKPFRGFVKGRTIQKNIARAVELPHKIDRKTKGGNIIIKVDLEKAYDKIDWISWWNSWKS